MLGATEEKEVNGREQQVGPLLQLISISHQAEDFGILGDPARHMLIERRGATALEVGELPEALRQLVKTWPRGFHQHHRVT